MLARSSQTLPIRLGLAALLAFAFVLIGQESAQAGGGTVYAWGYNNGGQVGNGSFSDTGCECIPTPSAALSESVQVAGGQYHALAVRSDGTVRAWGQNEFGQLGNGDTAELAAPTAVAGLSDVVEVAGGGYHSLALLANGTVMSWGANYYGQLGYGTFEGPEGCSLSHCSKVPRPVPGLTDVIAVAASYDGSYALRADGSVMFWGYDYYGQSGTGVGQTAGCSCVPTPTAVPNVSNAVAIETGWYFALALISDGTVRSWGENYYSQIGTGAESTSGCYCLGVSTVSGLSDVRSLSGGGYFAAAVLEDGTARAWGWNETGQLGLGSDSGPENCNVANPCSKTPVAVPGLSGVAELASGYYSNLARLGSGATSGWGGGFFGELGDGNTDPHFSPTPAGISAGASEVDHGIYTAYALVGPTQSLNVSLAGAGSGTVTGREVECPSRCVRALPQGQSTFLRASPAAGFAGWSGPCSGTGTCVVNLTSDQTVTATFGKPKGTKITKLKLSGKKKKTAKAQFTAPGAVTGFECLLVKPKPKKKGAKKSAKKAKKAKFSKCRSPKAYKKLKPGKYTFKVRALNILGADAKPAKRVFKVKKPKGP